MTQKHPCSPGSKCCTKCQKMKTQPTQMVTPMSNETLTQIITTLLAGADLFAEGGVPIDTVELATSVASRYQALATANMGSDHSWQVSLVLKETGTEAVNVFDLGKI